MAPSIAGTLLSLFAFTLLLAASLIFFVEPMFAKMVLPLLGGSPAVWNTCVVYFQAVLLAGYVYAHLLTTRLAHARQVFIHGSLLVICAVSLPIALPSTWTPPADGSPVLWLVGALTVSLAAPFFVVAATGPLLQRWFSHSGHPSASDPYFLYSASNLGSLVALLAYPLFIERRWALDAQAAIWTAGYIALGISVLACAGVVWRAKKAPGKTTAEGTTEPAEVLSWPRRLRWMALAFVPSSLMLGVTTYMSTDIAAAPLLWVVPLALYLMSFVVAFARRRIVSDAVVLKAMAVALLPVVLTMAAGFGGPAVVLIPLHLCAFFLAALAIHTELARDRPGPASLTEFYLWIAFGGVLGGLFNTLVAPVAFSTGILEYPIALIAACLLRPTMRPPRAAGFKTDLSMLGVVIVSAIVMAAFLRSELQSQTVAIVFLAFASVPYFVLSARPVWFTIAVALLLAAGGVGRTKPGELLRERTFFGVYEVRLDKEANSHTIYHGSTLHGEQSLDPVAARRPSSYYNSNGPIGQAFQAFGPRLDRADIGVIGLGAGGLAGYVRPTQHWTFYEIDPAVQRIATTPQYFTFLRDCGHACDVVLGDARLSLSRTKPMHDFLVLDAFSSDAIPLHLITREAVQMYFGYLSDDGVVAFHISNRHLNLRPVLGAIAADLGLSALSQFDRVPEKTPGRLSSEWLLMARSAESFRALKSDSRWVAPERGPRVWTDAFADILSALK